MVKKLNFCSDFEHKVWSRFWSWSSGKIWNWSLAIFFLLMSCRGWEVESWSGVWSLGFMKRLMFGWDFEVHAWSRFWRWILIKICVWTCAMNSTLRSVASCLWQCFMPCPRKGFVPSALISKNILLFWNGIFLLTFQPTNYSNFKVLTPGCALSILIFVFINRNLCFVNKFFWTTFLLVS